MCAYGAHFDTHSVRSVFCDAHVAAENDQNDFFAVAKKLCEALSTVCVQKSFMTFGLGVHVNGRAF